MSARTIWTLLAPVRGRIVAALVVQVIASLLSVVPFWALAILIDRALSGRVDDLTAPLIAFVTGLGLSAGLGALALFISHLADVELQAELQLTLADRIGRLPLEWSADRSSGSIRQLLNDDVKSLHHLVAHVLVEIVAGVLTPITGLVFCYALDWRLGLAATAPMVLYALLFSALAGKETKTGMAAINDALHTVSNAIVEYVNGISVLKVFTRDAQGFRRFTGASEHFRHTFRAIAEPQIRAQSIAVSALSAPVVAATVLGVGIWSHHRGWSSPGELVVVTTVAMLVPVGISTVALSTQARRTAQEAAQRIADVLREPVRAVAEPAAEPMDGSFELVGVSYAYPDGPEVLHDVTLSIPDGATVALVGPSGSGKSTLAALMAGLREPTGGTIAIGGVDRRRIPEMRMRQHLTAMLQDSTLLRLSIHDNIALAAPGTTRAEVEDVIRAVGMYDRIVATPHGFDSIAGVDTYLSGGEAQRIVAARSILAGSAILVLDEATSAADPEAEHRVQQAVDRAVVGQTLIMVTHRLATATGADLIVVLEDGRIVETGRHHDLLAADGLYRRMWSSAVVGADR
ncbi:MAG: ABC transporter ATP-binding protein [Rhodococcus sp.]|nr:ABC transporter ATP-binding protein [Rhodococcus sp. (in: high G+C Gram-positive bacteria)]